MNSSESTYSRGEEKDKFEDLCDDATLTLLLSLFSGGSESWTEWTHPRSGDKYTLSLKRAGSSLSEAELEACYNLVEELSGPDYKASSYGWHPESKREEMRSPDLRYILVKADKRTTAASGQEGDEDDGDGNGNGDEAASIQGFTSLMPTTEDNQPVIYCYEMQLRPELQGCVFILLHPPLSPGAHTHICIYIHIYISPW